MSFAIPAAGLLFLVGFLRAPLARSRGQAGLEAKAQGQGMQLDRSPRRLHARGGPREESGIVWACSYGNSPLVCVISWFFRELSFKCLPLSRMKAFL